MSRHRKPRPYTLRARHARQIREGIRMARLERERHGGRVLFVVDNLPTHVRRAYLRTRLALAVGDFWYTR